MKQIINGKVYNTETATLLATWHNDLPDNDFSSLLEKLFITKKGQYFLYGNGGAMTWCAQSCAGGFCGGKVIKLVNQREALEWCEHRQIDPDLVASIFDVTEG